MPIPPPSRTYGRIYNQEFGTYYWAEVDPDESGQLDGIYITTLCQVIRLSLGEDPFHADLGIPAQQSVVQQVYPDFYINRIQQYFAPYFANLSITRQNEIVPANQRPVPKWRVNVLTHAGFSYAFSVVPL